MTPKVDRLIDLAGVLAREVDGFFQVAGPGRGDHRTIAFMSELRRRAEAEFGADYAEARICGAAGLRPDFYFPDEETIVEIALSLRNPASEFEREKVIMAQEAGHLVTRLVLVCKPEGERRHAAPASREFIRWMRESHRVTVDVRDLQPLENIPENELDV